MNTTAVDITMELWTVGPESVTKEVRLASAALGRYRLEQYYRKIWWYNASRQARKKHGKRYPWARFMRELLDRDVITRQEYNRATSRFNKYSKILHHLEEQFDA